MFFVLSALFGLMVTGVETVLQGIAAFVVNGSFHGPRLRGRHIIDNVGPDPDLRLRRGGNGSGHGRSPVPDIDIVRCDKPHVTVNARSGIPAGITDRNIIDEHRENIVARGVKVGRKIAGKAHIAVFLRADGIAVQINF